MDLRFVLRSFVLPLIKRDNVRDHRAGTIDSQEEKSTRKSGFACIALLSGVASVSRLTRIIPSVRLMVSLGICKRTS